MNTLPHATTILCYGDSNTYGQKPDRSGRFTAEKRWTGVLQAALGHEYYIIEEGLGGRTTDLDHPNPNKPSRNGLSYFKACLDSHSPLDMVVVMLGTNDFKTTYGRSAEEIASSIGTYAEHIADSYASSATQPTVLLISPPYMNDGAPQFYTSMPTPGIYDHTSVAKSHNLAAELEKVAQARELSFLDSAPLTQVGEDGCHMTELSHYALGQWLAELIRESKIS